MQEEDSLSDQSSPIYIRSFQRTPFEPNLRVNYYRQKGMARGSIDASYYNQNGSGGWISNTPYGTSGGATIGITPNLSLDVSKFPGGAAGMINFRKQF
jgi:hypothetical protein